MQKNDLEHYVLEYKKEYIDTNLSNRINNIKAENNYKLVLTLDYLDNFFKPKITKKIKKYLLNKNLNYQDFLNLKVLEYGQRYIKFKDIQKREIYRINLSNKKERLTSSWQKNIEVLKDFAIKDIPMLYILNYVARENYHIIKQQTDNFNYLIQKNKKFKIKEMDIETLKNEIAYILDGFNKNIYTQYANIGILYYLFKELDSRL